MGKVARSRVESELAWQHQRASYLAVYERLLGATPQNTGNKQLSNAPQRLSDVRNCRLLSAGGWANRSPR